jgi:hypothetical protein
MKRTVAWLLGLVIIACSTGDEDGAAITVDENPTIGPVPTSLVEADEPLDERTIDEIEVSEYRLILVASREGDGDIPTATVFLRALVGDEIVDEEPIDEPGSFFWRTVTAPEAVCQFLAEAGEGEVSQVVTVQLLLSPSLGCSPFYVFEIRDGALQSVGQTPTG